MITLKQLRYALAVDKTLHFKKASELSSISQSTLSTAISELEAHIGEVLFERDNRKVLLTPVGKQVLDRARQIVDLVSELEEMGSPDQGPLGYPITVGMIPTIAPYLLPKLLPILNRCYPNAEVKVIEEQSHRLIDLVKRGEMDTAILALPYDCEGLLCLEFWEEDFYWVTLENSKNSSKKRKSSRLPLNFRKCLLRPA